MAFHPIPLSIESIFKKLINVRQRELVWPKFDFLGDGAIALGGSLPPVPWHFKVNLGTEDTSVLIHSRQREGLGVLDKCYEEHIINSGA